MDGRQGPSPSIPKLFVAGPTRLPGGLEQILGPLGGGLIQEPGLPLEQGVKILRLGFRTTQMLQKFLPPLTGIDRALQFTIRLLKQERPARGNQVGLARRPPPSGFLNGLQVVPEMVDFHHPVHQGGNLDF